MAREFFGNTGFFVGQETPAGVGISPVTSPSPTPQPMPPAPGGTQPVQDPNASVTPASLGLTTPSGTTGAEAAARAAAGEFYDANGNVKAAPTYNEIYQNTLNSFQSEIDQLEKSKADARVRIANEFAPIAKNREGSEVAVSARRGLLGSDFGNAAIDRVKTANANELQGKQDASDSYYNNIKTNLMSQARQMASEQYTAKTTAYSSGAKEALAWITTGRPALQKEQATNWVGQAIAANLDITDPKYSADLKSAATAIGVTPEFLKQIFAEQTLTKQQKKDKAAREGQITLSEGQKVYAPDGKGGYKEVAAGDPKAVPTDQVKRQMADGSVHTFLINKTTGADIKDLGTSEGSTGGTTTPFDTEAAGQLLADRSPEQIAAFNSIPDNQKGVVLQLINGDALLSDVTSKFGAAGNANLQAIIKYATSVDPTFSVNKNKERYAFKTRWNDPNGKSGQIRQAVNTGMGHLARLQELTNELNNNGNFKKANTLKQWFEQEVNGPDAAVVAQFKDTVSLLAAEIAKAYKGGVPDKDEVERQFESLTASAPKNVISAIINNKLELMSSLLKAQGEEYKRTVGNYPDEQLLHREVLDQMQAAGISTKKITADLIKQGMKASSVSDYETAFPDKKPLVDKIVSENPNLTEVDVLEILQGSSPYVNNNSQVDPVTGQPLGLNNQNQSAPGYTDLQNRNLAYAPQNTPPVSVNIGAGAAVANNNPGNLRNVDGSWMKFISPEEGWKALLGYVERAKNGDHPAYKKGDTLYQFFARYAPSADNNNPKAYAEAVAKQIGYSPLATIGTIPTFDLARAIAFHDSSTTIKPIA